MNFIGRFKLFTVMVYTMVICFEINHKQPDVVITKLTNQGTSTTHFLNKVFNQFFLMRCFKKQLTYSLNLALKPNLNVLSIKMMKKIVLALLGLDLLYKHKLLIKLR